ncbi:recombinase RecA [Providencia vermicola]|uniref:recombinase RecA n=1 Tax=Providencia vermicola TaxID=333965 RepID=UPI0035231E3C
MTFIVRSRVDFAAEGCDWENPHWDKREKVHCWRNYAPLELQQMWHTFTDEQKKTIFYALNLVAGDERWE